MSLRSGPSLLRANYDDLLAIGNDFLGFDPMILVNLGLILGGIAAFIHYIGRSVYSYAQKICLSSVHINEDDQLYEQVMRYIADKHLLGSKSFRSVKATTPQNSTWEDEEDAARAQAEKQGGGGSGTVFDRNRLISYRRAVNRVPVRLAPFNGSHVFRHGGHFLLFKHNLHRANVLDTMTSFRERGYVQLQCLGRSLAPLQRLLDDAQEHALERSRGTTSVFRGMTGFRGDRLMWQKVLSRPARDIRTVILDRGKKNDLLADMNEYLHPNSRRWYANRGIPYRRGYLFSGSPGTGKTSLTAALAGVFALDIYVISLLDAGLNESHLMRLLGEVPSRCIVLLEDVDAAGLTRPGGGNTGSANNSGPAAPKAGDGAANGDATVGGRGRGKGAGNAVAPPADSPAGILAQATGASIPATAAAVAASVSNVSLSGLLNAIDGVSSHEGHILIMTTNHAEQLDRALVRPGRVDKHIVFELPRRPEMHALFLSMYHDSPAGARTGPDANGTAKTGTERKRGERKEGEAGDEERYISSLEYEAEPELVALADRFARALPEERLSLAAIQGYLLQYKRDPELACDNAAEWGRKTLQDSVDSLGKANGASVDEK